MKKEPVQLPEMTDEQKLAVSKLSKDDIRAIDEQLIKESHKMWRKVARVVGTAMENQLNRNNGIPDLYYASRVRFLVESGLLESQGNLDFMGYSEVRLPMVNEEINR